LVLKILLGLTFLVGDKGGNIETDTASITMDKTNPSANIEITTSCPTDSRWITLDLSASDNGPSGVDEYRIRDDSDWSWSSWSDWNGNDDDYFYYLGFRRRYFLPFSTFNRNARKRKRV